MEEIAWGGVLVDGIPALDNPRMTTASAASYLNPDDPVFGVEINGDARAYPLRIANWHEMVNDVVGGVPVSLAYCTLCGSGILFDGRVAGRAEPFTFGSSGLLYRSNKLMYDRQTDSLWEQFAGHPVTGKLTGSKIELKLLLLVLTARHFAEAAKHVPGERIDIRLGCRSQTASTHFRGNVNRRENLIPTPALERYRMLLVSLAHLAEFLAVRAPVVSTKTRPNPEYLI